MHGKPLQKDTIGTSVLLRCLASAFSRGCPEVSRMVSKKDRRRSGYITPRATVSKKELIRYNLFITPFYDDWEDYRDSLRDWYSDFKTIKNPDPCALPKNMYWKRIRMNKKQKKLLKRRQAKRCKRKLRM